MKDIRISVSKLEQFRKYKAGEFNMKLDELIDYFMGKQVYKPAMVTGTAFHALAENSKDAVKVQGGWSVRTWDMEQPIFIPDVVANAAISFRNRYPDSLREVWHTHRQHIPGYNVSITMRVDQMEGKHIHDIKTGGRPMDYEFYERSFQWRWYLSALNCNKFIYDCFLLSGEKEPEYETCSFNTYAGIRKDCTELLMETLEFIEHYGLIQYVQPNYKKAS